MNLRWRQIGAALAIGALLGAAVTRLRLEKHGRPEDRHARLLERFSSELSLSPGQRAEVERILLAKKERMSALRAEIHPRFEALRESTRRELRALLDAEQQRKYDELEKEREARRRKRRERSTP